ncbi:hypothetical protein D7X30_23250 [Corallococcus sp. AB011P]|uniref:hypothetical protein n=1 Tax=unclassified Corallococcus TaxID=2685029 RepID=UPI000EA2D743|nr:MULTISPECIES: hypothetical protein [unclassified Corallococcus]RKG56487.1 hypothetical protein D7X30_23250 [Corallococcus sp. AB011P]RKH89754.1 hypothetical protein D7Y21_09145 [Corallococcus sp. AB045]
MSADPKADATYQRFKARIDALTNAPPLEKARTFLKSYCAPNSTLEEVEDQIRHVLGFNSIPLWTGIEGLETVLSDPRLPGSTLVSLVREDAKRETLPATPEAARQYLEQVLGLLREYLPKQPEVEGVVGFGIDEVYNLRDPAGKLERLRCIDMVGVGNESFAVLVLEHARDDEGPFTVFRYKAVYGQPYTYDRVTDAGLIAKVLEATRS